MIGYDEAPMAWGLTRGMARTIGVDLLGAVFDGWLSRKELASLVDHCRMGGCSAKCQGWLSHPTADKPLGPPLFCAIRGELTALAPEA